MKTHQNTNKVLISLMVAALTLGSVAACNQGASTDAQIAELQKKADDTQKALEQAQADKAALQAQQQAAADADKQEQLAKDKAAADAKIAKAEADAAAARREAAAARKRAAASSSSGSTSSAYVEPRAQPAAPVCQDCGTVSAVTAVQTQGEGTGMGAVAGAIAGAVIGHQFGRGQGNTAAKIIGGAAGAYAGNAAEKRIRSSTVYDVTVSMDNGGSRTVRVGDPAGITNGERVRVDGNNLVRI